MRGRAWSCKFWTSATNLLCELLQRFYFVPQSLELDNSLSWITPIIVSFLAIGSPLLRVQKNFWDFGVYRAEVPKYFNFLISHHRPKKSRRSARGLLAWAGGRYSNQILSVLPGSKMAGRSQPFQETQLAFQKPQPVSALLSSFTFLPSRRLQKGQHPRA